jgi:hypothetical protein
MDYATLKSNIAAFLARDDMTAQIPTFIDLAEARMSRELETRAQERRARATVPAGQEFVSLPTDLRALRLIRTTGSPSIVLDYMTPEVLFANWPNASTGTPREYSVIGCEIVFRPIPDAEIVLELIYGEAAQAVTSLSDSQTTTILSRHPDAYLYGALAQAYVYLQDEGRAQWFDSALSRTMQEVRKDMTRSRFGLGSLSMKTAN